MNTNLIGRSFHSNLIVNLEAEQIPLSVPVYQLHRLLTVSSRAEQKRHFRPVALSAYLGVATYPSRGKVLNELLPAGIIRGQVANPLSVPVVFTQRITQVSQGGEVAGFGGVENGLHYALGRCDGRDLDRRVASSGEDVRAFVSVNVFNAYNIGQEFAAAIGNSESELFVFAGTRVVRLRQRSLTIQIEDSHDKVERSVWMGNDIALQSSPAGRGVGIVQQTAFGQATNDKVVGVQSEADFGRGFKSGCLVAALSTSVFNDNMIKRVLRNGHKERVVIAGRCAQYLAGICVLDAYEHI